MAELGHGQAARNYRVGPRAGFLNGFSGNLTSAGRAAVGPTGEKHVCTAPPPQLLSCAAQPSA